MAILGNGLGGILQGQQIAQNNFALTDLNQQNLQGQLNDQLFADLVLNQGASPGEAFATLGQTSPIPGLSLQNTGNALSLQQALLPQALSAAQRGQFGPLNQVSGFFGQPGNATPQNLNSFLPLLGAPGLAANLRQQQQQQIFSRLFANIGQTPGIAPPPATAPFAGLLQGSVLDNVLNQTRGNDTIRDAQGSGNQRTFRVKQ